MTVIEDSFSDHSALYATFDLPGRLPPQWHWPRPVAIPWDELHAAPVTNTSFDVDFYDANPQASFASWSSTCENGVISALQKKQVTLPRGITGRGQTLRPFKRPPLLAPLRPGREGDELPTSDFGNRSLHLWFKQLRRLQAYVQRSGRMSQPEVQADQMHTWCKIRHGAGFQGGFLSWWLRRPIQLHGSPYAIPWYPPGPDLAHRIFCDFRANYRRYEQWQLRRRSSILKAKAHDHNKMLYRQLRNRDLSPPDHFTLSDQYCIALVLGDNLVELDSKPTIPMQATWMLQGQLVQVELIDDAQVRIHTDLILAAGQTLSGKIIISDFTKMEQAMAAMWKPIWQRHANVAPDRWQRAIAFARHYLPEAPSTTVQWTPDIIHKVAAKYKKYTATGPDGWSRLDVASLDTSALSYITDMFSHIQNGGAWPQQLVTGFVCPVRKTYHSAEFLVPAMVYGILQGSLELNCSFCFHSYLWVCPIQEDF